MTIREIHKEFTAMAEAGIVPCLEGDLGAWQFNDFRNRIEEAADSIEANLKLLKELRPGTTVALPSGEVYEDDCNDSWYLVPFGVDVPDSQILPLLRLAVAQGASVEVPE